jgi:hypothetical protein
MLRLRLDGDTLMDFDQYLKKYSMIVKLKAGILNLQIKS